jgi:uncharacterized protein
LSVHSLLVFVLIVLLRGYHLNQLAKRIIMVRRNENPFQKSPERPEIEYPCKWVYKVIGEDCSLIKEVIISACFPLEVKISYSNSSSKGKYHSLNAEIEVPDEEVRLNIYEILKGSPAIKIIL